MSETDEQTDYRDFENVLIDFVKDILNTFPELEENLEENLKIIISEDKNKEEAFSKIREYCKNVYPEKFFDILYQNNTLFDNNTPLFFLPEIDFQKLWHENITDKTRKTIWNYLQLILFTIVSDVSDSKSFGDTAKLFEAINEDELKNKLEETFSHLQNCFDCSGGEMDSSGINLENLPNPETIHEHVNSMMGGKLGKLAQEIAEETAEEFNVNMEGESDVNEVFQTLLKNPTKLMGLVKKVGSKLDDKIKSGDINESELLAEAGDMVKNMKNMPGMENIQSMLGKMAGGGGNKVNMGAMQAHLDRTMRLAKQKERMKRKATTKTVPDLNIDPMALAAAEKMALELLQEEETTNNMKNYVFRTGEKYEQSTRQQAPSQTGKKKKKKNRKGGK